MKKAILSTVYAWGATVIFVCISWLVLTLYNAVNEGLSDVFIGLLYVIVYTGSCVAMVVFPTCLLVVGPLLKLLPRSSPLWNPAIATVIGAIAGPLAMYLLWAGGYTYQMVAPDLNEALQIYLTSVSALAGATFAFSYTKLKQS